MDEDIRLDLCDGKYTYVLTKDGRQFALRYGEPWQDLVGDKFVLALATELHELREKLKLHETNPHS